MITLLLLHFMSLFQLWLFLNSGSPLIHFRKFNLIVLHPLISTLHPAGYYWITHDSPEKARAFYLQIYCCNVHSTEISPSMMQQHPISWVRNVGIIFESFSTCSQSQNLLKETDPLDQLLKAMNLYLRNSQYMKQFTNNFRGFMYSNVHKNWCICN